MVLTLACFLAAGCAGVRHASTTEPVPVAPPSASTAVLEAAKVTAAPEAEVAPAVAEVSVLPAPPPAVAPVRPVETAPVARAGVPKVPPATVATVTTVAPPKPPPRPVANVPAVTVPAPRAIPKVAAVPAVPQLSPAPLDFKSLASRLRETRAIGVFTKLALKNEVDDLVDRFRTYHKRQGTATIAELRRNYDMLLLKVLSLLQDSDPPLARDIVRSRAAIWSILEDPRKFTESNLMAGATP
jgi:hypothetical protein